MEESETILLAVEKKTQNRGGKVEISVAVRNREIQRRPCFLRGKLES